MADGQTIVLRKALNFGVPTSHRRPELNAKMLGKDPPNPSMLSRAALPHGSRMHLFRLVANSSDPSFRDAAATYADLLR